MTGPILRWGIREDQGPGDGARVAARDGGEVPRRRAARSRAFGADAGAGRLRGAEVRVGAGPSESSVCAGAASATVVQHRALPGGAASDGGGGGRVRSLPRGAARRRGGADAGGGAARGAAAASTAAGSRDEADSAGGGGGAAAGHRDGAGAAAAAGAQAALPSLVGVDRGRRRGRRRRGRGARRGIDAIVGAGDVSAVDGTMRALVATTLFAGLAALAAGCGTSDPCDGHDGACLALRVEGHGVGALDQLAIHVAGAALLDGHTPGSPGAAVSLPVATAIYLPAATGSVAISVLGLRSGLAVGQGDAAASIR